MTSSHSYRPVPKFVHDREAARCNQGMVFYGPLPGTHNSYDSYECRRLSANVLKHVCKACVSARARCVCLHVPVLAYLFACACACELAHHVRERLYATDGANLLSFDRLPVASTRCIYAGRRCRKDVEVNAAMVQGERLLHHGCREAG